MFLHKCIHRTETSFYLFSINVFYETFRNADTETGVQKITIVDKFMHPNYDTPDRHVAFTPLSGFQIFPPALKIFIKCTCLCVLFLLFCDI